MYTYNMRPAVGVLLKRATTGTIGIPHLSLAPMSLAHETSRASLFEIDKFVRFRALVLLPLPSVSVQLGFRSLSGEALPRLRISEEDGFISTKRIQSHSDLLIRQPIYSIREEDRTRCRARGVANVNFSVTMGISRTHTGVSRSSGICRGLGFKADSSTCGGTRAISTSTPEFYQSGKPVADQTSRLLHEDLKSKSRVVFKPDDDNFSPLYKVERGKEEKGEELGKFRRRGPSGRGSADADNRGKSAQSHEMGAVRGQMSPNSSGRTSLNPKESSPEEETMRKYPPRRLEGEKKWQYSVRKKQLGLPGHTRGSTRKIAPQFRDDEELGDEPKGPDWRWKKISWLCKEIPALRPRPIVSILNEQRKWIHAEDTKYIIEHLLQIDQTLRAHRVLKWEMQQPWYEFNYEVCSKVAVQLGQNNKLSRTRDIYDMIIKNGKVPNVSTYEVLINCYIVDGENTALTQAWSLFNQMGQLGGHEPPPTLSYNLFQGLVQKGLTFLNEADEIFKRIKMSGLVCSTEMYSLLVHIHGTKGNKDRVDDLIKEMKEAGLPVGLDVYAAILKSCAKDRNVDVGEQAFADMKTAGYKPIPSIYSSLIKMYGKAGLPVEAIRTFEEMRETGTIPNLIVYEPMIEVAVLSDNRDQAEKLLKEAQERGIPSLHACYNSVMELYSKNGLLEELDRLFNDMDTKGYPPNQASFNVLIEAYVRHRLLEKAEAVYETMKQSGKVKPNRRTYDLMIKLYGEARKPEKLKEVFKQLTDRKLDIPEESKRYLEAAVNPEQLEVHRLAKLKLKREQREMLAGVLLAGAGVRSHDRNRTYEIHFGLDPDSEVGLPLLNHMYQQFSDWSTGPPTKEPSPSPKSKILLAFQTVSHGSFRFFAHQYRPNHRPVIPRLVHRWLTPRALAYWYMYGGNKCPQTGNILFNASAYSDQEIMLVVNALKSRTIDCEKKRTGRGLSISFNGRSAIWLWGLMEPYILPEVIDLLKPNDDQGGENIQCSNYDQVGR